MSTANQCPSGEPSHRWEFDADSKVVFCWFCGVLETELVAPDAITLRRIAEAKPRTRSIWKPYINGLFLDLDTESPRCGMCGHTARRYVSGRLTCRYCGNTSPLAVKPTPSIE